MIREPLVRIKNFGNTVKSDHPVLRQAKLFAYSTQQAKDNDSLEFEVENDTLYVVYHSYGVVASSWNKLMSNLLSQFISLYSSSPITFCRDEEKRFNYIEVFVLGL